MRQQKNELAGAPGVPCYRPFPKRGIYKEVSAFVKRVEVMCEEKLEELAGLSESGGV